MLLITALCAAAFSYAEEGVEYYDTREEAAEALREAMKERQRYVKVGIYEKVDEESIKTIISEVLDLAIEHTGDPKEGDYLKYHYAEYKGKAETDIRWGSPVVVIRLIIDYYTDAKQEKQTDKKVKEIIKSLDLKGKSDYKKVRAIHDYICEHTEYDSERSGDDVGGTEHTAYGALVEGKAVCQGYSNALYRLLLEAGVDNRIINGNGVEPGGLEGAHSWNIVSIGGVYFYVDATWDDSTESDQYFLRNRDDFEEDHVMSDEYGEKFVTETYSVSQSGYAVDYDTPIKAILKSAKHLLKLIDSIEAA